MNIPSTIFDFSEYVYDVIFEQVDTNFLERLFMGKEQKMRYYIRYQRRTPFSRQNEEILHYCTFGKRYLFASLGFYSNLKKPVYWDNSTEPERLLTNMMSKLIQSQDNVVFSTKDL
jgi:hypothetical protein